MTNINEIAPDFTLPASGGEALTLSDLQGSAVVVFFYPRDDTSGCTKESIAFSELLEDFKAVNTKVIGISKDSIEKHEKFIAKHGLSVSLASDENDEVCEAYDVWKEKSMYGKKFMGIERSTFLINADGKIAQVWRKVKVPGHAEAVLDAAKAL